MGYASYSVSNRSIRAADEGYFTESLASLSTQTESRCAHPEMNSNGILYRECKDSEAHPHVIPIQFYLDVTGSMLSIPQELIRSGLPTLMSTLIQHGIDASLMFGAIGDHECDKAPLQVAQFESGDAELDMWLTRTWLEGGGGGNAGESYLAAWYFASNHVKTDAWDKRKQKGFVFTIGDEPTLNYLPNSAISEIMGSNGKLNNNSAADLLIKAQETNHVYHIFIEHGTRKCDHGWKQLLGDNLIIIKSHEQVVEAIWKTVLAQVPTDGLQSSPSISLDSIDSIML